jgi:hypothetical protein
MIPSDNFLYEQVKKHIYARYPRHSAYRSGLLVKIYKQAFSELYPDEQPYIGPKPIKSGLPRWFAEEWTNQRGEVGYKRPGDIYRPNKRITNDTPTTFGELSKSQIDMARKQKRDTGRANYKTCKACFA